MKTTMFDALHPIEQEALEKVLNAQLDGKAAELDRHEAVLIHAMWLNLSLRIDRRKEHATKKA